MVDVSSLSSLVNSFSHLRFQSGMVKIKDFTPAELLGIIDDTLACLVSSPMLIPNFYVNTEI